MIETTAIKKQQDETRISLRSSALEFLEIITRGTHCSAFEAEIIINKAQEDLATILDTDIKTIRTDIQKAQMRMNILCLLVAIN